MAVRQRRIQRRIIRMNNTDTTFLFPAIYTAKVALYGPSVSSTFNFYDGIWGLFAVFAAWHIETGQYGS